MVWSRIFGEVKDEAAGIILEFVFYLVNLGEGERQSCNNRVEVVLRKWQVIIM